MEWAAAPQHHLSDAISAIDETIAQAPPYDEALGAALLRMTRVLLRRRYLEDIEEAAAFLKRVLRHAIAALSAAAESSDAAQKPPHLLLLDTAHTIALVLEPSRELYLFGAVTYPARPPSAQDAADPLSWAPALFAELLNYFATAGGFSASAKAIGTPGALRLTTSAALLSGLCSCREVLAPRFAAPACAALAAASSTALTACPKASLQEAGVDRAVLVDLLTSLHRLEQAADQAETVNAGNDAVAEKVEDVALKLGVQCVLADSLGVRLLGLSLISDVIVASAEAEPRKLKMLLMAERGGGGANASSSWSFADRAAAAANSSSSTSGGVDTEKEWAPSGALSPEAIATFLHSAEVLPSLLGSSAHEALLSGRTSAAPVLLTLLDHELIDKAALGHLWQLGMSHHEVIKNSFVLLLEGSVPHLTPPLVTAMLRLAHDLQPAQIDAPMITLLAALGSTRSLTLPIASTGDPENEAPQPDPASLAAALLWRALDAAPSALTRNGLSAALTELLLPGGAAEGV